MEYFSDIRFVLWGRCRDSIGSCRNHLFNGYYGLQFIRNGWIHVECGDGEPWQAAGPLVFFTCPDIRFTYFSPSGTRDHFYVCFQGDRVDRYLCGGLLAEPGRKIRITDASGFCEEMETLLRCLRHSGPAAHGESVLQLEKVLLLAHSQPLPHPERTFDRRIIRSLSEEIAEHPERAWNIPLLAEKYRISEVHFRRLFLRETGFPPRHYLLEHRIRYAAQLLRSTGMSVKEVAYASGFGGEFYFSRQFRKRMNQSPKEYRMKNPLPL